MVKHSQVFRKGGVFISVCLYGNPNRRAGCKHRCDYRRHKHVNSSSCFDIETSVRIFVDFFGHACLHCLIKSTAVVCEHPATSHPMINNLPICCFLSVSARVADHNRVNSCSDTHYVLAATGAAPLGFSFACFCPLYSIGIDQIAYKVQLSFIVGDLFT